MKLPGGPEAGAGSDSAEAATPVPCANSAASDPPPNQAGAQEPIKMASAQLAIIVLGTMAFLYVARPVVLPVVLAWMAAMTLQPLVRCLSFLRLPAPLSAAVVFCLLVAAIIPPHAGLRPGIRPGPGAEIPGVAHLRAPGSR